MTTIEQHLLDRHVNLELHRPVIDEDERVATFFLYDLGGRIVGYQQYRPDASKEKHNNPKEGRYFTYRNKACVAVFGLESLKPWHRVVFVTEGVFDAVRLTERGQCALAILSNDPSTDVKNFLQSIGKKIVPVCDPGPSGLKLQKLSDTYFVMQSVDLGDAEQETVDLIVRQFGEFTGRGPGHAWKA